MALDIRVTPLASVKTSLACTAPRLAREFGAQDQSASTSSADSSDEFALDECVGREIVEEKNVSPTAEIDNSRRVLSDIVVNIKYARYLKEKKRRETWLEVCERHKAMFVRRFPALKAKLDDIYARFVVPKLILPSMRGLQFAGAPIEKNNARIFNCAFLAIDDREAFGEIMFLLMSGCGIGFSVQRHHIAKLPLVSVPNHRPSYTHVIEDSMEGWADAVKAIMDYFFDLNDYPRFDYSLIRPKGSPLSSGGKAPGHRPLKTCLVALDHLLHRYVRSKNGGAPKSEQERVKVPIDALTVHDAVCHVSVAVLSGGIRRSALLSLFTLEDKAMRTCKHGDWWKENPQRGRSNNSAALYHDKVSKEQWLSLWQDIVDSHCGEPGAYWTNDAEMGCNPCCEIGLMSTQFCNLVEINAANVVSQADFEERCEAATVIGTLQASFTNFTYLRPVWKQHTEKEYLIGVGMTGIATDTVSHLDLRAGTEVVRRVNAEVARAIGIGPAARLTCVKPAGTTSTVLECSSGIHPWHSRFYWRRIQLTKQEALYKYLAKNFPDAVEDSIYDSSGDQAVARVAVKAPDDAILRTSETLQQFLERVRRFNVDWVRAGHNSGNNANNVSATITFDEKEEAAWLGEWLWANRSTYHGLSVLPRDLGSYKQTPFEEIDEATYEKGRAYLQGFDITQVCEEEDNTTLSDQAACAGGMCELISSKS